MTEGTRYAVVVLSMLVALAAALPFGVVRYCLLQVSVAVLGWLALAERPR